MCQKWAVPCFVLHVRKDNLTWFSPYFCKVCALNSFRKAEITYLLHQTPLISVWLDVNKPSFVYKNAAHQLAHWKRVIGTLVAPDKAWIILGCGHGQLETQWPSTDSCDASLKSAASSVTRTRVDSYMQKVSFLFNPSHTAWRRETYDSVLAHLSINVSVIVNK